MLQTIWHVGLAVAIVVSVLGGLRNLGNRRRLIGYAAVFAVAAVLATVTAPRW